MHIKLTFTAMLAAAVTVSAAPASDLQERGVAFDWANTKVRGVNLGGWLVLEPFITPSIFDKYTSDSGWVVDEWSLCEKLGKKGCHDALKPHWDSFISLSDFWKIKNAGFNVVRIPIGYWAYMDAGGPYTSGQDPYLDKAISWARETGLKVIVDLHGAPKSQNGFDHSGHKGWLAWGQGDSIAQTHRVLKTIGDKYGNKSYNDVIIAIELLNEPNLPGGLSSDTVKQFYRDRFFDLRLTSDTPVMLHDGFWDPSWLNNFLTPQDNGAQGVIVDHHDYQIFGGGVGMSVEQHRQQTCNSIDNYRNSDKWTIVGEWSGALTDCAKYLNGFRAGNRYEGSFPGSSWVGSCAGKSGRVSDWSQEWKDNIRRYIETQLDAYEANTEGWVFWNFKTEGSAGEWDLFQLLDGGVFPQPLWDRKFGKFCTNF